MAKHSKSDVQGVDAETWEAFLNAPVTFDPLRDPNWQPDREDYRLFRDAAIKRVDELAHQRDQAREALIEAQPYVGFSNEEGTRRAVVARMIEAALTTPESPPVEAEEG